jgi:dolichyl-phosphate-mannose-protein mannosyltransferase
MRTSSSAPEDRVANRPSANHESGADLSWKGFSAIILCFILLSVTSNLLFPAFEGPDENSHFHYSRLLAQGKGLPVQTDPQRSADTEGFGPPLYYLVPAAILRIVDPERGASIRRIGVVDFDELARLATDNRLPPAMNPDWIDFGIGKGQNLFFHPPGGPTAPGPERAIHWMRLFSTCCALLTLTALFLLAKEVVPGQERVQLTALAVVAFNPQFIYLSGLLNNDNLVTALATLTLWRSAHLLHRGSMTMRQSVLLGILFGLGMLAKPNMSFLAIPIMAVVWYRSETMSVFARHIIAMVATALAISLWFYCRNAWLYGNLDLLGWKTRAAIHPFFVLEPEQRWEFFSKQFIPYLFTSYWGRFGWLTLLLPWWLYLFYGLISAASLASLLPEHKEMRTSPRTILLLWGILLLNLASLLAFNMIFQAEQGRLLYPSIAALALLIAIGLDRAAGFGGRPLQNAYFRSLPVILLLLALYSQWAVIRPVYFH